MQEQWKKFLLDQGAKMDQDLVVNFEHVDANPTDIDTQDYLVDLSNYGVLRVSGSDANTFLQGQLTNDIRVVGETSSTLSALCSPKGRVLANFRILQKDTDYLLIMPIEQVAIVLKRLRLFVLMSKVTLEDASNEYSHLGIAGPQCEQVLAKAFSLTPLPVNHVVQIDEVLIVRVPGVIPRYELHGTSADLMPIWSMLRAKTIPVGTALWQLWNIRAGFPTIFPSTADSFVPQMINYQLIDGVSFKKGCYTGQEIVARMQYLGKLKRRMYRARILSDSEPQVGQDLYSEQSTSGQGSGKLVNVARAGDDCYEVLAVVEISSIKQGTIRLGDQTGPELEFLDLPYPFAAENEAKDQ